MKLIDLSISQVFKLQANRSTNVKNKTLLELTDNGGVKEGGWEGTDSLSTHDLI